MLQDYKGKGICHLVTLSIFLQARLVGNYGIKGGRKITLLYANKGSLDGRLGDKQLGQ